MFTGLIRTIILYILIIAGIRLMGKRQVGELEPSELVLSLIIADLAAVPMQDFGIPLLTGVIPILALLAMTMILSVMTMKSIRFRALLCGRLLERNLRVRGYDGHWLDKQLEQRGLKSWEEVFLMTVDEQGQIYLAPREREGRRGA